MKTMFLAHMLELRFRFLYVFFSFLSTFLVATLYSTQLTFLICTPFSTNSEFFPLDKSHNSFIFTHLTEALYAAMELSLLCAFWFCLPFSVYQLYSFIVPSIYQQERIQINWIVFSISLFFLISVFLAFSFILPKICVFLQQFQYQSNSLEIKLQARIAPAIHWVGTLFLFIVSLFQTPTLFFLLCKAGLPPCFLRKNRKYAFFLLLLLACLISPPDVYSEFVLTFVGCFFYEWLLWCALFYHNWIKNNNMQSNAEQRQQR